MRGLVLGAVVVVALAGCEQTKKSLGLGKQPPDEFQVVRQAPLSVPPDFGLRPPEPGAARPQEEEPRDQAQAILLGDAAAAAAASPGVADLLAQAGAAEADPEIRRQINEDNALLADDLSFTERLVFWRQPSRPGVVVDPEAEAQRLAENAASGAPPTAGPTPIIEEREKALLEGLF
ncbi:MAG: DUF3035 domain-containing protein [Alphaproteobacteria bacterium]